MIKRSRRNVLFMLALAAVGGVTTVALLEGTAQSQTSGTVSTAALRIDGRAANAQAGAQVSDIGDLNADSFGEVAVATAAGEVYVIYGRTSMLVSTVDLNNLGDKGFRILTGQASAPTVTSVGDVNGDSYYDFAVGVPYADQNGRTDSGSMYVVFGAENMGTATIDLENLGTRGFRVDGAAAADRAGNNGLGGAGADSALVKSSGDINGDGLDDVVLGAFADNNGRDHSGSVYVVFGKATTDPVDLAALGSGGFRIDGAAAGDNASDGARLGDVNGDAIPDVAVGAGGADNNGRTNSGSVYVVFGKPDSASVDLATLGSAGYRVDGLSPGATLGPVARAGDVNGDDRDDLVVGAPYQRSSSGEVGAGAAYVIFGKADTTPVDVASLGSKGFFIQAPPGAAELGRAVAGAGDINSDGRDDVVVGAPGFDRVTGGLVYTYNVGAAFVIYGKASSTTVQLSNLGSAGFAVEGAAAEDRAGTSVSSAGDVTGDGLTDIILGAPQADNNLRSDSGSAYVVKGHLLDGTVARPGYKACPPEGQTTANFPVYELGASFEGLARIGPDRVCQPPFQDERHRANFVSYVYGAAEESSTFPIEVQSWPVCERNPSFYMATPEDPLPRLALPNVRGATALSFDEGHMVEVYTGTATVAIFGHDPQQILRAAQLLRPPGQGDPQGAPLPATATGAIQGQVLC